MKELGHSRESHWSVRKVGVRHPMFLEMAISNIQWPGFWKNSLMPSVMSARAVPQKNWRRKLCGAVWEEGIRLVMPLSFSCKSLYSGAWGSESVTNHLKVDEDFRVARTERRLKQKDFSSKEIEEKLLLATDRNRTQFALTGIEPSSSELEIELSTPRSSRT